MVRGEFTSVHSFADASDVVEKVIHTRRVSQVPFSPGKWTCNPGSRPDRIPGRGIDLPHQEQLGRLSVASLD